MAVNSNPMRKNKKEWHRDKVVEYVFQKVATTSLGIESIVKTAPHEMPTRQTIMEWIVEDKSIADKYTRAKELQADYMAEEILDIADEGKNDYMTVTRGDNDMEVVDHEHIQRSKLRIESRKWLMSKLKPKAYGDKVSLDHQSPDGSMTPKAGLDASKLSTETLQELMKAYEHTSSDAG